VPPPGLPDGTGGDLGRQVRDLLRPHLQLRRFPKGSLLWREGETTGMLVAVKSGRVKIYRLLPTGRSVTLFLFASGDVFGFLPFIDGAPYPAYAQAIEEVEADVMARSTLLQVLRAEPDLAPRLLSVLGRRLRDAFDLIQSLSTPGARARVAAALLALVPDSREVAVPGAPVTVALPVTAHEFAGALGLAAETFSRALSSLADDGMLERAGTGRYRLTDLAALQAAAQPSEV
jgi:CRP/FNR family cyclic AMP-dependent transcriptional regulator